MGKKWTPHVEGNSRGKNFHRGNNKANNTRYEPNKLFNILAGGTMVILGIALVGSLVSSGVAHISKAAKASQAVTEVKQAASEVKNTVDKVTAPKAKVSNETELIESVADEVIDKVKDKMIEKYDIRNFDYIYLLNYSDVNTEDSYKDTIVEKLKDTDKKYLFIVYNSVDNISQEVVQAEHDSISAILDATHEEAPSKYYTVGNSTLANVPFNGNIVHAIPYT